MQTNKKSTNFTLISIFFLIGVWVGSSLFKIATNYHYFSVNKKISIQIDPFQIVVSIINIVLVVYVLRELAKNDEFKKTEVKLIIDYFTDFREEFEKTIRNIINKEEAEFTDIVKQMKSHRMRMNMIIGLAESRGLVEKNSTPVSKLKEQCYNVLELLTYTPPREKSSTDDINIENGKIKFNQDQIDRTSKTLFEMQKSIFELIIEINQSI